MAKPKFRIIRRYPKCHYQVGEMYVVQKRTLWFWRDVREFGSIKFAEECLNCLTNPVVKEA